MSTHKHIDAICAVVLALTIVITLLFMNGSVLGIQTAHRGIGYESRLFDASRVHTIDIAMDDWDSFIANCENEEYAVCAVVIDGEAYKDVGIRAKGNTSLSTVSAMNSDRYSFKIEFDQYDSTKSYHGLDKLSLNNLIQDTSYMKDYLTYRLMGLFGVAAPLCSYVQITVNGEDWGLYLAVEGVEESFLQRNFGSDYGELYKPDSMDFGGGRGNGRDFDLEDFLSSIENDLDETGTKASGDQSSPQPSPQGSLEMASAAVVAASEDMDPSTLSDNSPSGEASGSFEPPSFGGGFGGPFGGMGNSDVKLQYIDDDPDSYSHIFSNAKTDVSAADKARLIQSLKSLSTKTDLEQVLDIDEVLRYFVVHNFVVNGDSYTGAMIHNYYLYEKDGQLSMIPWDYNLAFGSFQGNDAAGAVNDPIDTPLSVTGSDRPMFDWILSDEEYTALYHQYFAEFLNSVDITGLIDETAALIAPYVEKDQTAFYSYDEHEAGVDSLRKFCQLRTVSIQGQLDGSIPSTDQGQAADRNSLIDTGDLAISDMGSMGMGGGPGNQAASGEPFGGRAFPGFGRNTASSEATSDPAESEPTENLDTTSGKKTARPQPSPSTAADSSMRPVTTAAPFSDSDTALSSSASSFEPPSNAGDLPSGELFGNMDGPSSLSVNDRMILLAASVAFLIVGLIVAKKYRR